ncbi:MAG: peptidase M20, partial [Planctomycetes bacterium]|nr:peptidase M20 [Planctomycetota bacterium]
MKEPAFLSIILAASLFVSLSTSAAELTPYQQLGRDIYRELIEIDTTHATGDTPQAAETLARRFR